MSDDPRNRAARYRMDPDGEVEGHEQDAHAPPRQRRPEDQVLWVDLQIRAAIDRGEFDDLPLAGKPIPHIDTASDPDWWLKKFIEREHITGVLPEALQLRKDDVRLDEELDSLRSEHAVRAAIEDFNARVMAARRQLQGGPPVVTPLRDADVAVAEWRQRRVRRTAAREEQLRSAGNQPIGGEAKTSAIRTAWDRLRRRG